MDALQIRSVVGRWLNFLTSKFQKNLIRNKMNFDLIYKKRKGVFPVNQNELFKKVSVNKCLQMFVIGDTNRMLSAFNFSLYEMFINFYKCYLCWNVRRVHSNEIGYVFDKYVVCMVCCIIITTVGRASHSRHLINVYSYRKNIYIFAGVFQVKTFFLYIISCWRSHNTHVHTYIFR